MVLILLCLALLHVGLALGQGETVLASTSWVAAFARGAGAKKVESLAPANLRDPSRYELTASDLARIRKARWVIYSGDELFADQLVQAVGDPGKLLKIRTENTPENIARETEAIAAALGSRAAQTAWIQEFQGIASRVKAEINASFPEGTRVVAHPSQAAFARWLGFDLIAEVEPSDLSPTKIDELGAKRPVLVLDSYHDPVGPLLAEKGGAIYIQLVNYPGPKGTKTLEDVFRHNQERIAARPPQRGELSPAEKAIPLMAIGAAGFLVIAIVSFILLRRLGKS